MFSNHSSLEDKNNMPSQKCRGALCQLAFGIILGVDDGCNSVVGEIARHRVLQMLGEVAKGVIVTLHR